MHMVFPIAFLKIIVHSEHFIFDFSKLETSERIFKWRSSVEVFPLVVAVEITSRFSSMKGSSGK